MDWTDFLRAGVNLGKPKVRFQWIWVDVVKIGRGYLVHENLKSAKWVYELSLFFVCWLWLTFMLTFKCHFTAVLLVRPLVVAGRIQLLMKIFICCVPAQILWEKSCSWDRGQIPLSQSDCRIPKLTISPEQIDEAASFLSCWYGQSGRRTLKLN